MDWDQSEVLPPELACVINPGWLWSDERTPINGHDLTLPAANEHLESARRAFVDEMERLRPGYVAQVQRSQECAFGVLGGLARYGLHKRGGRRQWDLLDAGENMIRELGLFDAFREENIAFEETRD